MDRRSMLTGGLAGAAGVVLTGCEWLGGDPPPPHPLMQALRDVRGMLARYEAVIAAHPPLAERLGPLRDNHRVHVTALSKLIGPQASASSSPSLTASPAAPAPVPSDEASALRELSEAERTGQETMIRECLAAKPEHAGVLGSIAACRASHREVLK